MGFPNAVLNAFYSLVGSLVKRWPRCATLCLLGSIQVYFGSCEKDAVDQVGQNETNLQLGRLLMREKCLQSKAKLTCSLHGTWIIWNNQMAGFTAI